MASSEKTINNRKERKTAEKKEGNKTIECDIQLIRHLQTTRAPNIILHDNDLKNGMGSSYTHACNALRVSAFHVSALCVCGDTILFMQSLVTLQNIKYTYMKCTLCCKYIEMKILEEELEIISTKKKETLIDLESKTNLASVELEIISTKKKEALVDPDSKTKLAHEELESQKKKHNVELEIYASAEKDGTLARIKIELDFTKRKMCSRIIKADEKNHAPLPTN